MDASTRKGAERELEKMKEFWREQGYPDADGEIVCMTMRGIKKNGSRARDNIFSARIFMNEKGFPK